MAGVHYTSDSNLVFRGGEPEKLFAEGAHRRIQILLHPEWWTDQPMPLAEKWNLMLANNIELMQESLIQREDTFTARREVLVRMTIAADGACFFQGGLARQYEFLRTGQALRLGPLTLVRASISVIFCSVLKRWKTHLRNPGSLRPSASRCRFGLGPVGVVQRSVLFLHHSYYNFFYLPLRCGGEVGTPSRRASKTRMGRTPGILSWRRR